MDFYYPDLQVGLTEPVCVTYVADPQRIFCQLRSMSREVQRLSHLMQGYYESQRGGGAEPGLQQPFALGQPCASRSTNGQWYRSLLQQFYPESQQALVIHVDCGFRDVVPLVDLRVLTAEFFRMPVMTYCCAMHGVPDNRMGWEPSLIYELRTLLHNRLLNAKIEFYNSYEHLYVVTLLAEDGMNMNHFYAMRVQTLRASMARCADTPIPALEKNDTKVACKESGVQMEEKYVPKCGSVELKIGTFCDATVEFILSPYSFWIRTEESTIKFKEVVEHITSFYRNVSKLEGIITKPEQGQLCCAQVQDLYYRTEVVAVQVKKVDVYLMDCGNVETVDWFNVKELPAQHKALPALAHRCCLADVFSLGDAWSPEAIRAFEIAVTDKRLVIHIVSKDCDKYTIEVFDQSRIQERNVGKMLALAELARYEESEIGPTPLDRRAGRSGIGLFASKPMPALTNQTANEDDQDSMLFSPYEDQLFSPGATFPVVVSHIENPGLFWCQKATEVHALEDLMRSIQRYCSSANCPYESGSLACLAKSPNDETWYRGFISEIADRKAKEVKVLYVDYGITETVPVANLQAMQSDFFHLKSQAFKCSLYNMITPKGDDPFHWDSKATEIMWGFVEKASNSSEFCITIYAVASVDGELFNIVDLHTPFKSVCTLMVERGVATLLHHATLATSVQLKSFYYSLHGFSLGNEEEIIITHVSPSLEFFCQLAKNGQTMDRLSDVIKKACEKIHQSKLPCPGPLCLAKYTDELWYRGLMSTDGKGIEVFFVDYGNTEKVDKEDLLPIGCSDFDLSLLPMQAIKCSLPDIPTNLSSDIVSWFESVVYEKNLRAVAVAKSSEEKLMVELYDGDNQINAMLKSKLAIKVSKNTLAAAPPFTQPTKLCNQRETRNAFNSIDSGRKTFSHREWDKNKENNVPFNRHAEVHQTNRKSSEYQESDVTGLNAKLRENNVPSVHQTNRKSSKYQESYVTGHNTQLRANNVPFDHQTNRMSSKYLEANATGHNAELKANNVPFDHQTNRKSSTYQEFNPTGHYAELRKNNTPFDHQTNRKSSKYLESSATGHKAELRESNAPFDHQTNRKSSKYQEFNPSGHNAEHRDNKARFFSDNGSVSQKHDHFNERTPFEYKMDRNSKWEEPGQSTRIREPTAKTHRSSVSQKPERDFHKVETFSDHKAGKKYQETYSEMKYRERHSPPFQNRAEDGTSEISVPNQDLKVNGGEPSFQNPAQGGTSEIDVLNQDLQANGGEPSFQTTDHLKHQGDDSAPHSLIKLDELPRRQIAPGTKLPVYVSYTNNVSDFYVQFAEDSLLDEISEILNEDKDAFETLNEVHINAGDVVCAHFSEDGLYYRGVVREKSSCGLNVEYIDYGNTSIISDCKTYRLPEKVCALHVMSVQCCLHGLISDSATTEELVNAFSERTNDLQLDCEFVTQQDGKWEVILYDQNGCINDRLTTSPEIPFIAEEGQESCGTAEMEHYSVQELKEDSAHDRIAVLGEADVMNDHSENALSHFTDEEQDSCLCNELNVDEDLQSEDIKLAEDEQDALNTEVPRDGIVGILLRHSEETEEEQSTDSLHLEMETMPLLEQASVPSSSMESLILQFNEKLVLKQEDGVSKDDDFQGKKNEQGSEQCCMHPEKADDMMQENTPLETVTSSSDHWDAKLMAGSTDLSVECDDIRISEHVDAYYGESEEIQATTCLSDVDAESIKESDVRVNIGHFQEENMEARAFIYIDNVDPDKANQTHNSTKNIEAVCLESSEEVEATACMSEGIETVAVVKRKVVDATTYLDIVKRDDNAMNTSTEVAGDVSVIASTAKDVECDTVSSEDVQTGESNLQGSYGLQMEDVSNLEVLESGELIEGENVKENGGESENTDVENIVVTKDMQFPESTDAAIRSEEGEPAIPVNEDHLVTSDPTLEVLPDDGHAVTRESIMIQAHEPLTGNTEEVADLYMERAQDKTFEHRKDHLPIQQDDLPKNQCMDDASPIDGTEGSLTETCKPDFEVDDHGKPLFESVGGEAYKNESEDLKASNEQGEDKPSMLIYNENVVAVEEWLEVGGNADAYCENAIEDRRIPETCEPGFDRGKCVSKCVGGEANKTEMSVMYSKISKSDDLKASMDICNVGAEEEDEASTCLYSENVVAVEEWLEVGGNADAYCKEALDGTEGSINETCEPDFEVDDHGKLLSECVGGEVNNNEVSAMYRRNGKSEDLKASNDMSSEQGDNKPTMYNVAVEEWLDVGGTADVYCAIDCPDGSITKTCEPDFEEDDHGNRLSESIGGEANKKEILVMFKKIGKSEDLKTSNDLSNVGAHRDDESTKLMYNENVVAVEEWLEVSGTADAYFEDPVCVEQSRDFDATTVFQIADSDSTMFVGSIALEKEEVGSNANVDPIVQEGENRATYFVDNEETVAVTEREDSEAKVCVDNVYAVSVEENTSVKNEEVALDEREEIVDDEADATNFMVNEDVKLTTGIAADDADEAGVVEPINIVDHEEVVAIRSDASISVDSAEDVAAEAIEDISDATNCMVSKGVKLMTCIAADDADEETGVVGPINEVNHEEVVDKSITPSISVDCEEAVAAEATEDISDATNFMASEDVKLTTCIDADDADEAGVVEPLNKVDHEEVVAIKSDAGISLDSEEALATEDISDATNFMATEDVKSTTCIAVDGSDEEAGVVEPINIVDHEEVVAVRSDAGISVDSEEALATEATEDISDATNFMATEDVTLMTCIAADDADEEGEVVEPINKIDHEEVVAVRRDAGISVDSEGALATGDREEMNARTFLDTKETS